MFPKFDAKSACLKKLHENFIIVCWCSIFYDFPVQVQSSEQHSAPKHVFVKTWLLERKKNRFFMIIAFIFIKFDGTKNCQKMPNRAWHFCFFQKNAMRSQKMPNLRVLALNMPSWQPCWRTGVSPSHSLFSCFWRILTLPFRTHKSTLLSFQKWAKSKSVKTHPSA